MRVGSLCTGYGGLEMGLKAAFGEIDLRFVSDIDKDVSTLLAHHHPDIPNLGDLTTVNWKEQDQIDVLTAGYPCQPFSTAGKRKGTEDERAIFNYISDALSVLRPRYVFLENVAGHLTLGGTSVTGSLASMGYDMRWGIVRASDTGAPHQRKRLFIWGETSDSPSVGCEQGAGQLAPEKRREKTFRGGRDIEPSRSFTTATDTGGERPPRFNSKRPNRFNATISDRPPAQQGHVTKSDRPFITDPDPKRFENVWAERELEKENREPCAFNSFGPYEPAIRRWETVIDRPAPTPVDNKGVNPVFVEWIMGLPEGHVTDLGLSRTAELKMLGNGVVPQQAHLALEILTEGGVHA